MNMKTPKLHAFCALFAGLFAVFVAFGAARLGWNELPLPALIVAGLGIGFFWYSAWRDVTDARKDDLLDKVDAIEEGAGETEHSRELHSSAPIETSDQIQSGCPLQRATTQPEGIQELGGDRAELRGGEFQPSREIGG